MHVLQDRPQLHPIARHQTHGPFHRRQVPERRELIEQIEHRRSGWTDAADAAGRAGNAHVSPLIAGLLPFGLDGRVAALIMKEDRWHAGMTLMGAGSPDGWRGVVDASNLVRVNREALAACREAAAKTKKEQRCTINVPAK